MERCDNGANEWFKLPDEIREVISIVQGTVLSAVQEMAGFKAEELFPTDSFLQRESQIAFEKAERLKNMALGERTDDGWYYCGISPDNQKQLFAAPEDSGIMDWYDALSAADRDRKSGDNSTRLPTRGELTLIFKIRHIVDGLKVKGEIRGGSYWSSTERGTQSAWIKEFQKGTEVECGKQYVLGSVRLVRG